MLEEIELSDYDSEEEISNFDSSELDRDDQAPEGPISTATHGMAGKKQSQVKFFIDFELDSNKKHKFPLNFNL